MGSPARLPLSLGFHVRVIGRRERANGSPRPPPGRFCIGAAGAPGFCQPPAEGRGLALFPLSSGEGFGSGPALPGALAWSPLMRGPRGKTGRAVIILY